MIYFDNAATSWPKPPQVLEAVTEAVRELGNPSRGAHHFSLAATRCVEEARCLAARLLGCSVPQRIAFTKNATEAINIAVASIQGHIVTTEAEHNSVLRPVYRHENYSIAHATPDGTVSAEEIIAQCRPDTKAIVIAHASNLTGHLAPVEEIGAFCRTRGIMFIVDAAQTAGLADIDMDSLGIDALCFTGHKSLYGLQGTGGICLSERFVPKPLLVGGSGVHSFEKSQPADLPHLLEAGTANAHGIASLAAGLRYVLENRPDAILRKAQAVKDKFLQGVTEISGITLLGGCGADQKREAGMPIVSLNVGDLDSSDVAAELSEDYGIAVRAGTHCAPLLHLRFGTGCQGAVRFSFSHFNTMAEVDTALHALGTIANRRS